MTARQFDELPVFSPPDPATTTNSPEIFNPYDHFYWADGWSYVPPPRDPFPPHDGTRLGIYIPSQSNPSPGSGSPNAGLISDGGFGAGPRNSDNNYWFNAESAYVGCDNGAKDTSLTCDFVATGYKYDAATGNEIVVATQHFPQPPCPGFQNCKLNQIYFSSKFQGLSSLSFYAVLLGQPRIFFVDTLALGWYNNTCEAGLKRVGSRK